VITSVKSRTTLDDGVARASSLPHLHSWRARSPGTNIGRSFRICATGNALCRRDGGRGVLNHNNRDVCPALPSGATPWITHAPGTAATGRAEGWPTRPIQLPVDGGRRRRTRKVLDECEDEILHSTGRHRHDSAIPLTRALYITTDTHERGRRVRASHSGSIPPPAPIAIRNASLSFCARCKAARRSTVRSNQLVR